MVYGPFLSLPVGSYPTPFLGYLLFYIGDPNQKTRYPKQGVCSSLSNPIMKPCPCAPTLLSPVANPDLPLGFQNVRTLGLGISISINIRIISIIISIRIIIIMIIIIISSSSSIWI